MRLQHILVDGGALCGSPDTALPRTPNGSPISDGMCGNCCSIAQGAGRVGKSLGSSSGDALGARPVGPAVPPAPRAPGQPRVSFLTCSYNRPDLLREAVQSLQAQTDPSWEQLICDDASTDPRVEETLRWAESDPRIRVWRRKANVDAPAVLWNFMLDRARGRYISILDDDNTKMPTFIERLAGVLDSDDGIELVTCAFVVVDGDKRTNFPTSSDSTVLNRQSTCDAGAMLIRRETFSKIGYFSEVLRTGEDWDWLRRAASFARCVNLSEAYATYRVHRVQRMTRSHALSGAGADTERIITRPLQHPLVVRVVRPPTSRLTASQEDAISSLDRAVWSSPCVGGPGNDLALVLSPFQLSDDDIRTPVAGCSKVVSVHIEDPYALEANLARVRAMVALGVDVWVSTNDAAAVPRYREVVGSQVIVCPLLGVDDSRRHYEHGQRMHDVDVMLCGYAYPSRKRFVDDLLALLMTPAGSPRVGGRWRVRLVGDGWEGRYPRDIAETLPTQGLESTYDLHARARAVVCFHREGGDCSDGPVQPASVNRGFMEGAFGARVFIDRKRAEHSLDPEDVVWYDGPADLARSLREYLDSGSSEAAASHTAKCNLLYTYQARVTRIINSVRSPRFLAAIP